jgi:hypothetical protein
VRQEPVEGALPGQRGVAAVFEPLADDASWTEQTTWADQLLAVLKARYEGRWDIWCVPIHPVGYQWCARPAGTRLATITVSTPEDLVVEIKRQEESPVRGREFGDLSTGELERVHRDLTASAALAVPSSGAYLMTVTQMQAIDAELDARRRSAVGQSEGRSYGTGRPQRV